MRKFIILSVLLCGSALAAGTSQSASAADASMIPQVQVVQHSRETVEEYRLHNQLYMIKVMPNNGRFYYLVDTDGDGRLDKRLNDLDPATQIPSWIASR